MNLEITHQDYQKRVKKCTELMKNEAIDVLLMTKPSNMYYFTGDGRLCAFTMISSDSQVAIGVPQTDGEDVRDLAKFDHLKTFEDEVGMIHAIAHFFKEFGIKKGVVGLEHTFLTKSMMEMITHPHAKPKTVSTKDCTNIISQLRMFKEPKEIKLMREAARVADIGIEGAINTLEVGMTESQVAGAGEYAMRQAGAEGFWRSYVSSGIRTRIAHGIPSNKRIASGDLVMIDLHPIVNNYSSDICRMVCVGKPSAAQLKAFNVYKEGLCKTIEKTISGIEMSELENSLHNTIKDADYGNNIFGPPIHGIGINFEEAPLPSGHAFFHGEKPPPPLISNIAIAIGNCGIYTSEWGVRIEDTVVVGEKNPIILTQSSRDLKIK